MVRPAAAIPSDIDGEGLRQSVGTRLLLDRRHPAARRPPSVALQAEGCRQIDETPPRSGNRAPRCSCITDAPRTVHLCRDTTRPAPAGCRRSCWSQHRGPAANPPGRALRERDETRPETSDV